MRNLVFLILLFVSSLQAQKVEAGFIFAPQITSSNLKEWEQINPLHTVISYSLNENWYFQTGYTVAYNNAVIATGYKNFYAVNLFNTNGGKNFLGAGITFPISKFNPAVLFFEPGTLYSFKEKNTFPLILSIGIFVPFKKVIYRKSKGSS